MKPWSVREVNSALLWRAVMEHSLLPHLTHAFAGGDGAVHACEGRAPRRTAAPRPFNQVCPRERKKDTKTKQVDMRDTRTNYQRPPDQVWFLQRPCCRSCIWQGCITPGCEEAVLLGQGALSGLGGCSSPKPLSFVGHGGYLLHRKTQIANLWVSTKLMYST